MAPSLIAGGRRFNRKTKTKFIWLPTIAAADFTPTDAEITGGTDLTPEISAVAGWATSPSYSDVPGLNSFFVGKLLDSVTATESSITFFAADDGNDASTFFTGPQSDGTSQDGFMMVCDYGLIAAKKARVYSASVASVSPEVSLSGPALIVVGFSIDREPKTITIPTLT